MNHDSWRTNMKVVEPEIMWIGTMADSRASSDIDLFVDLNFGALIGVHITENTLRLIDYGP